jgi:hypothetical protein
MNMYDNTSKINLHVLRRWCKVRLYFVEQDVVVNYVVILEVVVWNVIEKTQTNRQKWFVSRTSELYIILLF